MFIYPLLSSTTTKSINNNDRLTKVIRCNSPLKNSFGRLLFLFFFFCCFHSRSASEHARTRVANGASLGNNRQSNEHSEMAHLIGPSLTIYRYSDGALLLLPRTTRLSDIIEPQELASTYCQQ